jgi:hypothetical protein
MPRAVFILWCGIAAGGKPVSDIDRSDGGRHLPQSALQRLAAPGAYEPASVLPQHDIARAPGGMRLASHGMVA